MYANCWIIGRMIGKCSNIDVDIEMCNFRATRRILKDVMDETSSLRFGSRSGSVDF